MKYSDQEMIIGLSGKDKSTWETRLFHQYTWLVDTHRDKSKYPEELVSAYSDSILVFLENLAAGVFKQEAKIETYLFRIFQNKFNGELRKKNTRKYTVNKTEVLDHFFHLSDKAKNKLEVMITDEMIQMVQHGLKNLNQNCKELLMARFAEDLSAKDIANKMGYKSEGTVRTTQHRCLEKLKASYLKNHLK